MAGICSFFNHGKLIPVEDDRNMTATLKKYNVAFFVLTFRHLWLRPDIPAMGEFNRQPITVVPMKLGELKEECVNNTSGEGSGMLRSQEALNPYGTAITRDEGAVNAWHSRFLISE